jgi:hypothetical protein
LTTKETGEVEGENKNGGAHIWRGKWRASRKGGWEGKFGGVCKMEACLEALLEMDFCTKPPNFGVEVHMEAPAGDALRLVVGQRKLEMTSTMNVRRKCSSADFICLREFSMLLTAGQYFPEASNLSDMKAMTSSSNPYLTSTPPLGMPSTLCTLSLVTRILPRPLTTARSSRCRIAGEANRRTPKGMSGTRSSGGRRSRRPRSFCADQG